MSAIRVVEHLYIVRYVITGILWIAVDFPLDLFKLQQLEKICETAVSWLLKRRRLGTYEIGGD